MRAFHLLPATLLFSVATAIQLPDLQPFIQALPNALQDLLPESPQNATAHELLKRQFSNTCPEDFNSCANLGAPGLCCMSNAVCSADQANNVACCPSGAACTGTIGGIITGGTVNGAGGIVGATGTSNTGGLATNTAQTTSFQMYSSTSNGLVLATSPATAATDSSDATNTGFIVVSSSVVATPGAAVRAADIPYFARLLIRALQYLPI